MTCDNSLMLSSASTEAQKLGKMVDKDSLHMLKEEVATYEAWVEHPHQATPPARIPPEYGVVLKQGSELALQFYRHKYFSYLSQLKEEDVEIGAWLDVIRQAEAKNPDFSKFVQFSRKSDIIRYFADQRENCAKMLVEYFGRKVEIKNDKEAADALRVYVAYFEISPMLWLMVELGKLLSGKALKLPPDPKAWQQAHPKGSKVNEAKKHFEGQAVADLIDRAYDNILRNTVAHNQYRIDSTKQLVTRLDGTYSIHFDDLVKKLIAIQRLQSALHFAFGQLEVSVEDYFKGTGILSVFYTHEDEPVLGITQLWCFEELDKDHSWLSMIELHVDKTINQVTAILSARQTFSGPINDEWLANWYKPVVRAGSVTVHVLAVAPYVGVADQAISIGARNYDVLSISSISRDIR